MTKPEVLNVNSVPGEDFAITLSNALFTVLSENRQKLYEVNLTSDGKSSGRFFASVITDGEEFLQIEEMWPSALVNLFLTITKELGGYEMPGPIFRMPLSD